MYVIVVTLRECKVRPCDVSIQLYYNFRLLTEQGSNGKWSWVSHKSDRVRKMAESYGRTEVIYMYETALVS